MPLARGCLPKKGRSGLARVNTRRWLKEVRRRALSTFQFAGYGLPSLQCPLPLIPRPNPADMLTSSSPSNPTPSRSPGVTPVQSFFSAEIPVAGATNAVQIPGEIGACGSRAGVKVKAGRSGGEVLQEGDQDCQPFTGRAGEAERVGEELTEGFNRRQLDPRVTTPTPVTAFT